MLVLLPLYAGDTLVSISVPFTDDDKLDFDEDFEASLSFHGAPMCAKTTDQVARVTVLDDDGKKTCQHSTLLMVVFL